MQSAHSLGANSLVHAQFDTPTSRVSNHHRPWQAGQLVLGDPVRLLLPDALARVYVIPALSTLDSPLRRCRDTGLLIPGSIESTDPLPIALPARVLTSLLIRRTAAFPDRSDAGPVYTDLVRFVRNGWLDEVHGYLWRGVVRARLYVEVHHGPYRAVRGAEADRWLADGTLGPTPDTAPTTRLSADVQREYRERRRERRYRGAVTALEEYKAALPAGTVVTFPVLADVVADSLPDEPAFQRLAMGKSTDGAARDLRRAADMVFARARRVRGAGTRWVV